MKHTPGPWSMKEAAATIPIVGANGRTVASVRFREGDYPDAALIAAAPELLTILKQAVNEVVIECEKKCGLMADEKYKWVRPARELIAKAEGKGGQS